MLGTCKMHVNFSFKGAIHMRKKLMLLVAMAALVAGTAAAQDLRVEYRFNVARPDAANNYF
jgi:hypothetical protein